MGDVRVVVQALLDARRGVDTAMDELAAHRVGRLVPDPAVFGHDGLGQVTADFCGRWEYGIANLTDDGNALAAGLGESARAYAEAEHLTVAVFR